VKPTVLGPPPPACAPRRGRTAAFSLVELSVTVLIISVLATLAVPYWKKSQLNARSTALANDLRVFAGAFQSYAAERSDWPAATFVPGETPAGMQGYLSATNWERITPIGGSYTWARDTVQQSERYRAALLIQSVGENRVTQDRQLLLAIDRRLDDGNLETGNFRLGFRNQPVFVIEP
jgi:prepilin-type N-terminal cleavage/methylation domain-containing protein